MKKFFEWGIHLLNKRFTPLEKEEFIDIVFNLRDSVKRTHTGFDFIKYFNSPMLEFRNGVLRRLEKAEEIVGKFFEE